MNDGIIIHLDDDAAILESSQRLFSQLSIGLKLITCLNKEEFDKNILEHKTNVKCIIFDLLGSGPTKEEIKDAKAEFLNEIENSFAKYNIPIFIYSAFLPSIENKFQNYGTVFKVDKDQGLDSIFQRIQTFQESGFLDIFCQGGLLESEIYKDIHEAFTKQFRNDEIEKIILSVKNSNAGKCRERCMVIFKRIAIRALMSELLAPVKSDDETVNPTEHYYRKIGADFLTGDILRKKDNSETIVILAPRCDLAHKENDLMVCKIIKAEPPIKQKKDRIDSIREILTDNIKGKTTRWLPKSPVFEGGKVDLSNYNVIPQKTLKEEYDLVITLSDDLTNELLGKFSSCFLRTGINTVDPDEYNALLEILKEIPDEQSKLVKR
jgi:hypothetical protein